MKTKTFVLAATLLGLSGAARADDWPCEVVLCLANPQGPMAVQECVPPIKKPWKHLAKGKSFPYCEMNSNSSSGNSAGHQWASGGFCPPQYIYYIDGENGPMPYCMFSGAVTINFNGKPYLRTWWTQSDAVTEHLSAESANMEGASTRFQDDYAAWNATEQEKAAQQASQSQYSN